MSRRWTRRVIALGLGVLLTPLVLEGALRAAAMVVRESRTGAKGKSLALCQGDSFTFGVFLPPEATYPARLEALLREGGVAEPRVVNSGIPGKPTWIVKRELRQDLTDYGPRFALLLAGINNSWRRRPADHNVEGSTTQEWRIVRTWRLARAHFGRGAKEQETQAPEDEAPKAKKDGKRNRNWVRQDNVEFRGKGERVIHFEDRQGKQRSYVVHNSNRKESEFTTWIREDIARAARIAREEGVEPIILGYPADGRPFDTVNEALEATAQATGAPFVDFRAAFRKAARRVGEDALFFPDQHATALGCDLMARVVVNRLVREGLIELDSVPTILGGLPDAPSETELRVELVLEGDRPTGVRATYQTGFGAVLLVSGRPGKTRVRYTHESALVQALGNAYAEEPEVPLGFDRLLHSSLRNDLLRIRTVAVDGSVFLPLPRRKISQFAPPGGRVYACVVVVLPGSGPIMAVSDPIELNASDVGRARD